MTALPAISSLTDSAATQGDAKNFFTNQRAFLSEVLGTTGALKDARTAMQVPLHSKADKTGAYTVVAADQGKVINCSGTWTLALTAAATLGDGFVVAVLNSGGGTITIDPSSTETIDGATTKTLGAGKLLLIYCNGSAFASVGSVDAASIVAALGYTPANLANSGTDHAHDYSASFVLKNMSALAVGMIAMCHNAGSNVASGSSISGANLSIEGVNIGVGTWKNIGPAQVNTGNSSVFQRIT